jgi:uncharacterized protein Usg
MTFPLACRAAGGVTFLCSEPQPRRGLRRKTSRSAMLDRKQGIKRTMSLGLQLQHYRLTTAEILYHLPDHPGILQSYIWQDFDLAPRFPVLRKFIDFWHRELDGQVHSVRVASAQLVTPPRYRAPTAYLHLN